MMTLHDVILMTQTYLCLQLSTGTNSETVESHTDEPTRRHNWSSLLIITWYVSSALHRREHYLWRLLLVYTPRVSRQHVTLTDLDLWGSLGATVESAMWQLSRGVAVWCLPWACFWHMACEKRVDARADASPTSRSSGACHQGGHQVMSLHIRRESRTHIKHTTQSHIKHTIQSHIKHTTQSHIKHTTQSHIKHNTVSHQTHHTVSHQTQRSLTSNTTQSHIKHNTVSHQTQHTVSHQTQHRVSHQTQHTVSHQTQHRVSHQTQHRVSHQTHYTLS